MLELRNVEAGYGEQTVLRGVDLSVPDDSVVALLGPNGAGKTTVLRVASGLLKPWTGTLRVAGTDVSDWPAHRLADARVCHVPEGRGIFPGLTVEENLRLHAPDDDQSWIARIVEVFPRLGERRHQVAGTLSGGEQQMLSLARAYVRTASTVLLDEVSTGLAPTIVDEIFEYLELLRDRGAALLLVEQYVHRALELADYVYILNRGRVVFVGEPDELSDEAIMSSYLGEGVA